MKISHFIQFIQKGIINHATLARPEIDDSENHRLFLTEGKACRD